MATALRPGEADTRLAPGAQPRCPTCGETDPALLADSLTACCAADPVAYTCDTCDQHVYYDEHGDEPDHCPHGCP